LKKGKENGGARTGLDEQGVTKNCDASKALFNSSVSVRGGRKCSSHIHSWRCMQ